MLKKLFGRRKKSDPAKCTDVGQNHHWDPIIQYAPGESSGPHTMRGIRCRKCGEVLVRTVPDER